MESICVAFRLDFESRFLCSSLGFKASETYTVEENKLSIVLMRYLFPKIPRVGCQRVVLQERTSEGRSCCEVSKYVSGFFSRGAASSSQIMKKM